MNDASGHLRGQYLIALDKNKLNERFLSDFEQQFFWQSYTIFAGSTLQVNQATSDTVSILLIGYAVHHEFNYFSNEELLSWLLLNGQNVEDLIRLLQDCGGRYIALIEDKERTIAVTDCCAMRQLYWSSDGGNLLLSSSARLILDALGLKPEIDNKTSQLMNNPNFLAAEHVWYGDKWFDPRINKVVANHYLNMKTVTTERMNYYYNGPTSYDDILTYAAKVLSGLIKSIHSRYNIIQALTAGFDSRLLLSASKSHCDSTRYYIFDSNYDLNRSPDVKVATGLSKKLGLNFEVILPSRLRDDFLSVYRTKCYFPRILYNTAHIQWHYDFNRDRQLININGNCGEIARFFYQNKVGMGDEVGHLIKLAGFNQFFAPQARTWFSKSIEYCRTNNINVYDLFYWEQRMGNWGAMYRFEQDIAIDEFTPYNHKKLLLALLHVDLKYRKGPQYTLFRDLISQLWPETMSLPFNPIVGLQIKSRAKKVVKIMLGKK